MVDVYGLTPNIKDHFKFAWHDMLLGLSSVKFALYDRLLYLASSLQVLVV